jgi:hypothetical protein
MRKLTIGEKAFLACYNVLCLEIHKITVSEQAFSINLESFEERELWRKCYNDMKEKFPDVPKFSDFKIWGY